MAQNRSSAVMQQRAEAPDSLDDFPTPPWATRALCEFLIRQGEPTHLLEAWEPACNRGHMAVPLTEYFDIVVASDVHDYGFHGQSMTADFLVDWSMDQPDADWIITNPPFRLGADFVRRGLTLARRGVAMFVRSAFVEGADRYSTLFRDCPETFVLPFVERVVIWKGVLLDPDVPVWHPATDKSPAQLKKPASATAYSWLIWRKGATGATEQHRIPPCRRALTRPGDYPPVPAHLLKPEEPGLLEGIAS